MLKKQSKTEILLNIPWWKFWGSVAWSLAVVATYLNKHPLNSSAYDVFIVSLPNGPATVRMLRFLLWDIAIGFGLWGLGHALLMEVPVAWGSPIERFVFEVAIGLGMNGYAWLALGALGAYRPPAFIAYFLVSLAAGLLFWRPASRIYLSSLWQDIKTLCGSARRNPVLSSFALLSVALAMIMSFVPEISYDALVYHLGIPHWYLLEGRLFKAPNLHANYPFTWQMNNLYVLGLTGNETPAKFLHVLSGLMLCLGFIALAQRFKRLEAGWFAAAAFLTMPMVQMSLWTTGNDVATTLFTFLSIHSFAAIWWCREDARQRRLWTMLCGLLGGIGFGCKYTMIYHLPAILIAAGIVLAGRRAWRELAEFALIFGVTCGAAMFPWLLKNILFTGNPLYPFLRGLFGGVASHNAKLDISLQPNALGVLPEHWWGWLTLPWTVIMSEGSSLSFAGPLLLAGLSWLWAAHSAFREERPWLAMLWYALFQTVAMFHATRLLRYHLPYLSMLAAVVALAWSALLKLSKGATRLNLKLTAYAGLLVGFHWSLAAAMYSYQPLNVINGLEDPTEYVTYTHPGVNPNPSEVMYAWLGENRPTAKVLFVGEEKIYRCKVHFYASGVFDYNWLIESAKSSRTPEELLARFQKMRFTHLYINYNEAQRLFGYGAIDWTPGVLGKISEFWERYVKLDHYIEKEEPAFPGARQHLFLYRIAEEPISGRPDWNPLIQLYEDAMAKRGNWNVAQRAAFLGELSAQWPQVTAFRERLQMLERIRRAGS